MALCGVPSFCGLLEHPKLSSRTAGSRSPCSYLVSVSGRLTMYLFAMPILSPSVKHDVKGTMECYIYVLEYTLHIHTRSQNEFRS